jgi:hypothetical protein
MGGNDNFEWFLTGWSLAELRRTRRIRIGKTSDNVLDRFPA